MPRRRDKRTDTQNSDDYEEQHKADRSVHFGTNQFNRMLAPDQIEGDDTTRYSIRAWSNTLYAQRFLPWPERKELFRRAIGCMSYSYKLWHMFLKEFVDYCSTRSLLSKEYTQLNAAFQEALSKLPKMPRIWLMYATSLEAQHMISKARSVYNWSFRNLPLTQHDKIWHKFSLWAMRLDNSSTALSIIPRYLKLNPDFKEQYAEYLKGKGFYDICVQTLQQILEDEGYHSHAGKDKKDFYFQMVDIIAEHPKKVRYVGEKMIREGLVKYSAEAGRLWVKMSDYFIRLGEFETARGVLEEALNAIDNAKDFGIIFNAYCKFEEEMISALANNSIRSEYAVVDTDNVDYEIEVRMKRLETLIEQQPFLLHHINIRKNPNNIKAWLGLIALYKDEDALVCAEEAIKQIQPDKVENGRLSEVWIAYARLLRSFGDIRRCNQILQSASNVNYKMVEDYVNIWTYWVEMLLCERYYGDALKVVKHVLFRRRSQNEELKIKNIDQLLKSNPAMWQLYIDLEINIGTFESIKTAYERCKQHRSLTPIMLLNYTNFLWDNSYFEETFRVFEFAVGNFKWPALFEIWLDYTRKFVGRYANDAVGLERARSMFERLLKETPKEHSSLFYFMYLEFQENYGLFSHVVEICDRMVNAVPKQERLRAYSIYIVKVAHILGVTKTRSIFEGALQQLEEKQILKVGETYAQLQTDLGETERARAVYTYVSQFTDPRDDYDGLWKAWEKFEVEQGDKETFREYLRVKRSVEAKYSMLPPDLDKIEANVKKGLL